MGTVITISTSVGAEARTEAEFTAAWITRLKETRPALMDAVSQELGTHVSDEQLICAALSRGTGIPVLEFKPKFPDLGGLASKDSGTNP